MTTRLEPGEETIVGKPVYVVWDEASGTAPREVELRADGRLVTAVPFKREGAVLKAEVVSFRAGDYRLTFAGREFALRVRESPPIGFLQEFGWTVFAVAMAFAIGLSMRKRFQRRENADF